MRVQGSQTTTALIERRPGTAAKMAGAFVLGAAASGGLFFAISQKPAPPSIQAAPPQYPPIVVQLVPPLTQAAPAASPTAGLPVPNPSAQTAPAATPNGLLVSDASQPIDQVDFIGPPVPPRPEPSKTVTAVQDSPPVRIEIAPTRPAVKTEPAATATAKHLININTAAATELELLPHVGPAMAKRIIDYRTEHGPFKDLKDLRKVKGIGEKTLAKLLPLVTLNDGPPER
jgi:comEA protein